MRLVGALNKFFKALERAAIVISATAILAMVVTTIVEVVFRQFLSSPQVWTFEFQTQYLMVIGYFLAVSYTQFVHENISLDLFRGSFGARTDWIFEFVSLVLCLLFATALTYASWELFIDAFDKGILGQPSLPWPRWMSFIFVLIGFGILAIRFVIDLVGHTVGKRENVARNMSNADDAQDDAGGAS